jgi:hypothetical protein
MTIEIRDEARGDLHVGYRFYEEQAAGLGRSSSSAAAIRTGFTSGSDRREMRDLTLIVPRGHVEAHESLAGSGRACCEDDSLPPQRQKDTSFCEKEGLVPPQLPTCVGRAA